MEVMITQRERRGENLESRQRGHHTTLFCSRILPQHFRTHPARDCGKATSVDYFVDKVIITFNELAFQWF